MEKEQRTRLQKATQDARRLLEEEFRSQLLQTYDIDVEKVRWAEEPGAHLLAEQRLIREKLVAWIEHKEAQINDRKEALLLALREMAFTALNRFVALKLMEARELVRPCVSGGLESAGFLEFTAVAQGLLADQESSYRLYLETIFEDVSRELRALFDPRDPASLLWPKRTALLDLLGILNRPELSELWGEDETLGWVYQYFNGNDVKEMRDAVKGGAPRNSRELAVRNQFFTPRYVVEFLIDNTLGRIWYEMCQGNTILKDRCRYMVRRPDEIWLQPGEEAPSEEVVDHTRSPEELLSQPAHILHRPLKDPREIRMLDPACGSMHFGLYAFDLYLEIYAEAWEIANCSNALAKQAEAITPFAAFAANFVNKAAFLHDVPRLILQHNIHGIDIDPRATQIAKLTLWLRAQRAWQNQHVEITQRPRISHSNIVCAEPMPGEKRLLEDFADQQFPETERGLILELLENIFENMQLAGEAGSLLKIEQEVQAAIDRARKKWQTLAVYQRDFFSHIGTKEEEGFAPSLKNDIENLTKEFWVNIEERLYAALESYAGLAESSCFQRRLFAEDATQGFAFIDLCRKSFDAVVMNPPFGLCSNAAEPYLQKRYPHGWVDMYACFLWRAIELSSAGRLGAITSRSFISSKKLENLRSSELIPKVELLVDLGKGVMDNANVEAYAYTLGSRTSSDRVWSVDLLGLQDRAQRLFDCASGLNTESLHLPKRKTLLGLPNSRFLYSIPPQIASLLHSSESFEPTTGTVRCGLTTFDDARFLRAFWEVPHHLIGVGNRWEYFEKGGDYENYHGDIHLVINRQNQGAELAAVNQIINGQTAQSRQASTYYYRPGAYYTDRSQRGFAARALPAQCVIAGNAPAILSESDISNYFLLGWINARLSRALVEIQAIDNKFYPGFVKKLPWVHPPEGLRTTVESSVQMLLLIHRRHDWGDETSPLFIQPWAETVAFSFCGAANHWTLAWSNDDPTVRTLQSEVSDLFDKLYGVEEARTFAESILGRDITQETLPVPLSAGEIAAIHLSYIVGIIFGRWDARIFAGVKDPPRLPDPFAALPLWPLGMLKGSNGLPMAPEEGQVLCKSGHYPVSTAWDGILVDDPDHKLDVEFGVRSVFELKWRDRYEQILEEACALLGVSNLRDWFRDPSNFFAHHLKRYSKSRRQAPIYWQLSSGCGNYSIWIYLPRSTADTLYRVLRDFVEPRIQQAGREHFELEAQGALSGDAAMRLQEMQLLLADLRLLKSELDLVAPLWNPNLNDGAIINHAILWRITPYTPWQKKCKECWDKLVKGDYDWAHLAFHLWPERVIPKCTTDRSLAIAHGLEERLWQETNNGNWLPRQLSEADLQALIAEHTNPAVKNALERFLAAPPPVAPTRTRASRSTRSSGSSAPRRTRGTAAVVDAEATRQVLLALTAAPSDGLAKAAIADLIGVEANALTAVIKQLKESGQIDQLGERRGARYVLSEQGRSAVASETEGEA